MKRRIRDKEFGRDSDLFREQLPSRSDRHSLSCDAEREKNYPSLPMATTPKAPVILAKPQSGKATPMPTSTTSTPDGDNPSGGGWQEIPSSPTAPIAPKLSISFTSTNLAEKKNSARSLSSSEIKHRTGGQSYIKQTLAQANSSVAAQGSESSSLVTKSVTKPTVKLLDGSFHWLDNGIELMQDQSDFLVVGVIGLQGTGKSTILSLLASNKLDDSGKGAIFRQQNPEIKERAGHMTTGIDLAVTSERLILLDTQPILSASLLEQSIHDRKNSDLNGSSAIEIQSLQITSFLLTVCHVVVVVQDWFTETTVYNLLQTAEMLKPVTPSPAHDNPSTVEREPSELQPVMVFVHNKMESNMFNIRAIATMNETMASMTKFSATHCKGHFSMVQSNLYPGLHTLIRNNDEVNAFIFPNLYENENEEEKCDTEKVLFDSTDQHFLSLPNYVGRPSSTLLKHTFCKMMLSIPRHSLTHQVLTEKNWFHYAARTWEAIRKSQLISEYNRLLTG